MAMIKGKQIQSLNASKIVESNDKKFVTQAQIVSFEAKATTEDIDTAKTEVADNLAAARTEITSEIGTAKAAAIKDAKTYTDGQVEAVNESINTIDGKVTAVDNKVGSLQTDFATGLEARYTKDEIDAKLAQLGNGSGTKYKGTVASFEEIAEKFPNPEEGWLVACESDKKFYVYDADTQQWENFPVDISACTTHTKTIRLTVTDGQTKVATGIKTNGTGALQTSAQLVEEMVLVVNGINQTKTTDFTVALEDGEVAVTWKSSDFDLEASDVITLTYNQIV